MILQLTSLLDLLLIIVFVQYLEMQEVSARAITQEKQRREQVEAQRDLLLSGKSHNLYEVWEIHVNGNRSVYPDGSLLLSSATQKRVFQVTDGHDFARQLTELMKFSPKPKSPCILLLTWGNVRRDALEKARGELTDVAADANLQNAWGNGRVHFRVVEGGYLLDKDES
jgi:hypothetical protein